jgi:3-oxoacyl-[acyl-carrier protein] reductase
MLKGKNRPDHRGLRGIGRAIAIKLAKCGANVAVIYEKSEEAGAKSAGKPKPRRKGAVLPLQRADFEEAKKTVTDVIRDFGSLHILVNNAGITKDGLLFTMSESAFDTVLATNLKGAFHMIKHVCPQFLKNKMGKIINISSVAGLMGNPGQANYSASKAGLIGLTKSVAKELASRGICCNAIAPGFIETDMTGSLSGMEEHKKHIPLGRMGKAEEVAELAAFLAGDGANYITGEVIRIDGGLSM